MEQMESNKEKYYEATIKWSDNGNIEDDKILKIGETCSIPPYLMLIESSDSRKIKRIKVTINES